MAFPTENYRPTMSGALLHSWAKDAQEELEFLRSLVLKPTIPFQKKEPVIHVKEERIVGFHMVPQCDLVQ